MDLHIWSTWYDYGYYILIYNLTLPLISLGLGIQKYYYY